MDFIQHSSFLELAQAVSATVGVGFATWAVLDTVQDYWFLQRSGRLTGVSRLIAIGNCRQELIRLTVHTVLFILGVFSLLLAPPPPLDPLPQVGVVRVGLIAITCVKVLASILDRIDRHNVVRMAAHEHTRRVTDSPTAPTPQRRATDAGFVKPAEPSFFRRPPDR